MSVTVESTLGNSVLPGSYVDFYMKALSENGTIMFGKLMRDVRILVVHDSSGGNVFEDQDAIGTPSKIGFAVSQDYYTLLTKAKYLNVELVLVPRGSSIPNNCEGNCVYVTSTTLREYIDAQTITVQEDAIPEEIEDTETDTEVTE